MRLKAVAAGNRKQTQAGRWHPDRSEGSGKATRLDPSGEQAASHGPGAPLTDPTRDKMERAFGRDFSAVRVHSQESVSDLRALAYTRGSHIHFAPGQYRPGGVAGDELIAHELTHVVQQQANRVAAPADGAIVRDLSLEREADRQADLASHGMPVMPLPGAPGGESRGGAIQLKADGPIQMQPDPAAPAPDTTPAPDPAVVAPADPGATAMSTAPPKVTVPPVHVYSDAYKQTFLNKCSEANTIIDLAQRKYAVWLGGTAAAYSTAWQNHADLMKSLEKSYRLFEEILIGSLLAAIPGGVGGAIGKSLKAIQALKTTDFIVDGVKDFVKYELRSPIPGAAIPPQSTGAIFKPMPDNPLVWESLTNMRAQQELARATQVVLSWQHAMNNEENVDLSFDPVERVRAAMTIDGQSLLSIEPPDIGALRKKLEGAWLLKWIDLHWGQTAVGLSPAVIGKHQDKIMDYGESLGLDRAMVKQRLRDADQSYVEEQNKKAIASGHGLI